MLFLLFMRTVVVAAVVAGVFVEELVVLSKAIITITVI